MDLTKIFKPIEKFVDDAYKKGWLTYLLIAMIGFAVLMMMRG